MRAALSVSTVGHALVIAWGLISLPSIDAHESTPQPSLPVDLVSIEEFTELTAGTRTGERELPPAPPKPVREAEPVEQPDPEPQPEAEPTAAPLPVPEPEPAPPKLATLDPATDSPAPLPDPAPQPPAEAKPAPEPVPQPLQNAPIPKAKPRLAARPKPAPRSEPKQQQSFDADKIAALLNKMPGSGGRAPTDSGATTPSFGVPAGSDASLSISEIDALRAQIARCWNPPVGVLEADELIVRLGMELNADGTLSMPPRLLNESADPIFIVAAEAAIRAVNRCQPYFLPPEKYDAWRQIHLTFDPREMLGG